MWKDRGLREDGKVVQQETEHVGIKGLGYSSHDNGSGDGWEDIGVDSTS